MGLRKLFTSHFLTFLCNYGVNFAFASRKEVINMPNKDGTGPKGQGPKDGHGKGKGKGKGPGQGPMTGGKKGIKEETKK
jgi:hypothetical protein